MTKSKLDSPLKPILIGSMRLDSGRPLMYVDVKGAKTTDGKNISVMLTAVDIEYLIKYFKYCLPLLKGEETIWVIYII